MNRLSILIPVYNEANLIVPVLESVSSASAEGLEKELIVVDDASTDGTREILSKLDPKQYGAKIYFHDQNQGKGAAIRTARQYASGDIILIQDADFEYSPAEYPKLLHPILSGQADVVYGSRALEGRGKQAYIRYLGNAFVSWETSTLYACRLTDQSTCYKVFKADIFKQIQLRANRFDFDVEVTAKLRKRGVPIKEVAISFSPRTHSEGKKITMKDFYWTIWALIYYRLFD